MNPPRKAEPHPAPRSDPSRHIAGGGTAESRWRGAEALARVATLDVDRLVASHRAFWIVSPHPDDEVLALGGFLMALAERDAPVTVVSVTRGTASHPGSAAWTPERLATVRPRELQDALMVLRAAPAVLDLELPDGGLAACEDALVERLALPVDASDLVLAPWRLDGHPDHEACGRAGARAADARGATLVEYPVWAWHWATPEADVFPWPRARRLDLEPTSVARKRAAIRCFVSQTRPDAGRGPILPRHVFARFERSFEIVFVAEGTRG